jgi:hypothetical protein
VGVSEGISVGVSVIVGVTDIVGVRVFVIVAVIVWVVVGVRVFVIVAVDVTVKVRVTVIVWVIVGVRVTVIVWVIVGVCVIVGVRVIVGVSVIVGVGEIGTEQIKSPSAEKPLINWNGGQVLLANARFPGRPCGPCGPTIPQASGVSLFVQRESEFTIRIAPVLLTHEFIVPSEAAYTEPTITIMTRVINTPMGIICFFIRCHSLSSFIFTKFLGAIPKTCYISENVTKG